MKLKSTKNGKQPIQNSAQEFTDVCAFKQISFTSIQSSFKQKDYKIIPNLVAMPNVRETQIEVSSG